MRIRHALPTAIIEGNNFFFWMTERKVKPICSILPSLNPAKLYYYYDDPINEVKVKKRVESGMRTFGEI